jgi:hypothetical protein
MEERFYFERPNPVDLDAARIGVSKWVWVTIDSSMDNWEQRGRQIMLENNYDVLPILDGSDVNRYLHKDKPNPLRDISENSLHFRTPVIGVLSRLVSSSKDYAFLHNDSHDLVGLVSACNFNCREFATLVFSTVVRYEAAIANAIRRRGVDVKETEQYLQAKKSGLDVDKVEFCGFSTLLNTVKSDDGLRNGAFGLDNPSKNAYKNRIKNHIKLRNAVAHNGTGRLLVGPDFLLKDLHSTFTEMQRETTRFDLL